MPNIGLSEAVDIFIVACMLYLVLHWIRKTRAWSLFKGIVIILFIAAGASLFNLVTALWIIQNAYTMGLIAIVILFQPELRKALEQIGRGAYFNFTKTDGSQQKWSLYTVNELVKACRAMSAEKTGALIVMEQNVNLEEQERTGIPIDAVVSSQLLMNIFEKNAPLHDGALIIRYNRVVAAACILPLTSEEIGRDLGTRHRAAVGISEASDALVVLVSEETGCVSVAMGGQLIRDINENQLRDILVQGERADQPRFVLFKNAKKRRKYGKNF
jgi:diadenylate cyclase